MLFFVCLAVDNHIYIYIYIYILLLSPATKLEFDFKLYKLIDIFNFIDFCMDVFHCLKQGYRDLKYGRKLLKTK